MQQWIIYNCPAGLLLPTYKILCKDNKHDEGLLCVRHIVILYTYRGVSLVKERYEWGTWVAFRRVGRRACIYRRLSRTTADGGHWWRRCGVTTTGASSGARMSCVPVPSSSMWRHKRDHRLDRKEFKPAVITAVTKYQVYNNAVAVSAN